ncbi:MAG: type II toxin-antitoxin system death-on-curing family toxin, partial [Acidobacteria bacterium]|nr:type II toxin-antitoxin system death-on-curing family toxin [Acidobacteriota bacterium]
ATTFGGEDLYPDLADKAAALMHSLVLNHPFIDGNKRIAVHAAELFVLLNAATLIAGDDEIVDITLAAAKGKVAIEALAIWFRQRLRAQD